MNAKAVRTRYPSDITQHQWDRLAPLLAGDHAPVGRPRVTALRDVIDALNYRWETGCVWRMLPHDFPPWATVYTYYRDWQRRGVLGQIREILRQPTPRVRRSDRRLNPDGAAPQEPPHAAAWPADASSSRDDAADRSQRDERVGVVE